MRQRIILFLFIIALLILAFLFIFNLSKPENHCPLLSENLCALIPSCEYSITGPEGNFYASSPSFWYECRVAQSVVNKKNKEKCLKTGGQWSGNCQCPEFEYYGESGCFSIAEQCKKVKGTLISDYTPSADMDESFKDMFTYFNDYDGVKKRCLCNNGQNWTRIYNECY